MKFRRQILEQRLFFALSFFVFLMVLTGCSSSSTNKGELVNGVNNVDVQNINDNLSSDDDSKEEPQHMSYTAVEQDGTVFYEIFVRSFYDTNGDGIGDLNGVTAKLDYLEELGIGGIWLMPIFESSTYHGYDTNDYYKVNNEYGTNEDLRLLVEEAHKRNIKVIVDLVINHSGYNHPWFQEALTDPNSEYRSWYQFLPADAETRSDSAAGSRAWHLTPDSSEKYLGIFDSRMPDLNFNNEAVVNEMITIAQYWIEQTNVDGYRLDAAKHIFGDFKSNLYEQETTDKNIQFWQAFRAGVEEVKPNAYLIGEVWDSSTYISYYLNDALSAAFNFDLAEAIGASVNDERDGDLGYVLQKTYSVYQQQAKGRPYFDAPFLTNHDQTRIMSILHGDVNKAKMAANILLTLPGNPYLYYGEELGLFGNKPDENLREPMPWNADEAGGDGQTSWKKSVHNSGEQYTSVEQQLQDDQSLLNHYKKMIGWRNSNNDLKSGDIFEYVLAERNRSVSVYVRATEKNRVLVVHNLSSEEQVAALNDTSEFGLFEEIILSTNEAEITNRQLIIPPYTTVVLQ